MATTIELSEAQQEALSKTKECTTLLDNGTEVPVDVALNFLKSKSEATQLECARALGYQDNTKKMLADLQGMIQMTSPVLSGGTIDEKRDSQKESTESANLPVAPTTAFNVMRLVQLGYFPKDYAPLWGDKPGMFHKGTQMFYVLPGKMGEWARTKANTVFQKKFDRDAAYKDFMRDLTKQMNAELEDWFKQNKLSNKANIDAAHQSLDAMNASFAAGKDKEAFAHFDTLTEKMGMQVNGKWHEKSPADLATTRAEQDGKTTSADARVQKAKDQKILRDGQLKGAKDDLKAKKADINTFYAREGGHGIDPRFNTDGVKVSDIDMEIKKLELEKITLERHDVALTSSPSDIQSAINGRDDRTVRADRDRIGYLHPIQVDAFIPVGSDLNVVQGEVSRLTSEISDFEKTNGHIEIAKNELEAAEKGLSKLQTESATLTGQLLDSTIDPAKKPGLQARLDQLNGVPGTLGLIEIAEGKVTTEKRELQTKKTELQTKKTELQGYNKTKANLLLQSEQNQKAFDWYEKRIKRIAQITEQVRAYTDLKPLVEAKNKSIKRLGLIEKSILKADEATTKREQLARDAHAEASPIHEALDKLNDPSISRSERLALNDKLNELLVAKKPEAERIERLLKGSQAEKNQAIRELKGILDAKGKGVDYFKSSLDSVESKIKGLQTEAARIMTEYDRQAVTGDVEALRKKMEVDIGKINTEIERYNADARVKYGVAAATLTPVQLESLHLQTKLGGFFDLMNKGVIKAESLGSKPVVGKAMRGVYGAMTLAGLGQLGVTGIQSGGKQMAIDAADMGIGFVPVVGGAYDILVGSAQLIMGEEITSKRKVDRTDALKRMGFGVLGLIPIAGQAFKAAAKGEKLVEVARKVAVIERAADVTGKVLILNEAKNLGVALYDATGSVVTENGGVKKTAESLYTGTPFPINK